MLSIVYKKVTLWLMCCYKLERSASEDAQQLVSAKKNLHQEFLRLPVIQVFRKPVQNPWLSKRPICPNEQCVEHFAVYTQDFLWTAPILLLLCDINCNVQHVRVHCLCSFIMQNLNIAIFTRSQILFDVCDHLHDNCVFVFQH